MIEKAPLKPYLLNEYDPERLDVDALLFVKQASI
jgi:hypothetical protein